MAFLATPGKLTFIDPDTDGPLELGTVETYVPTTTTPKSTYQDEGLTALNTNPITLDANGQCIMWVSGLVRIVVRDVDGNQIYDLETGYDDTSGGGGGSVVYATPSEVAAGVVTDKVVSPYNLAQSGVLLRQYPNLQKDLGGIPNGNPANPASGFDNASAFASAVASPYSRIWLDDGYFRTTGALGLLQKYFDGPGRIISAGSGEVLPGRFTYLSSAPTRYPTQGATGWFAGDTSFIEAEYFVLGEGVRDGTTQRYFESTTIPHNRWFLSYTGSSGVLAHIVSGGTNGSTSMTLNSAATILPGQVLGVSQGYGGAFGNTIVVSTVVGNVITFTPALTTTYGAYSCVARAPRTMQPYTYQRGRNRGGGDFYGDLMNMTQEYVALAGQTHFFETSTVGQYGGVTTFGAGSSGTYATVMESQLISGAADVAAIADVESFVRDNDTGARSVVWIGSYYKSEGSKAADVAHLVSGLWRVALDTVRANLTEFSTPGDGGNVVLNTAIGHRWAMNSSVSTSARGGDPTGQYPPFYGNVLGDMFIESGTDGSGDYISMRFARAAPNDGRMRMRPTVMTTNKGFQATGEISSGTHIQSGLNGVLPTRHYFGTLTGTWIEYNGTNLRATKDSGATWVNIV